MKRIYFYYFFIGLNGVSEDGLLLLFTSMINTCNKLKTLDISNNKITLLHSLALKEIFKKGSFTNIILQRIYYINIYL